MKQIFCLDLRAESFPSVPLKETTKTATSLFLESGMGAWRERFYFSVGYDRALAICFSNIDASLFQSTPSSHVLVAHPLNSAIIHVQSIKTSCPDIWLGSWSFEWLVLCVSMRTRKLANILFSPSHFHSQEAKAVPGTSSSGSTQERSSAKGYATLLIPLCIVLDGMWRSFLLFFLYKIRMGGAVALQLKSSSAIGHAG